MIKTAFAKLAKVKAPFKINQKICIALAVIITVLSISTVTVKYNESMSVKALDNSESVITSAPSVSTAPAGSTVNSYNKVNLCKVTIVKHDDYTRTLIMRKDTVKKALDQVKISVGNYDKLNCNLSDYVYDGMKIVINEVKYKLKSSTSKMSLKKFKKSYPEEDASSLNKNGKVKVNKTVQIKYVNGEKTSKKVKSLSYKSVDVYKKYSSLNTVSELKPSTNFKLDKNGVPLNYKKKITGTASAYSCGTHTATGKRVKPGYIAVNPKQIPYGTKLYIRSSDGNYIYGYASAEDTGGFVAWGNTVADLFFWSESDCRSFGRRSVEIYVLD